MKILIVDDNMADRKLLRYNCERHEYKDVIEARDGEEGLEMARQQRPDLIISDALMPRMDGFHFLKAIKSSEELRTIPFIFYSATYTGYNEAELARSLGAEAFITKPMEPEEFWKNVEVILEKIETGKKEPAPAASLEAEPEYLREYGRIVAAKLEEKVNELVEANERIERSEAFVKNILESIDEGFVVINREFTIVAANKAYANEVGMPVAEIIGKHCYECSHHLKGPCFEHGEECAVRHTFETGKPYNAVHVHRDLAGSAVYIETKSFPMKVEQGGVTLAIEICVDITEKRKLEEQLRQSQKMEAVGQLAGGIAHDFNNILTAIIGYGSIVQKKMKADDPQRTNVDQIIESGKRAALLTNGLLAFSRKQVINPQNVNLNEIILRVEKFLRRIIGEDIGFNTSLMPGTLTVNADSGQLEQVLMNLVGNARDAMPRGGALTIETETVAIDDEFIRAHGFGKPGRYARVSVSDTGVGMDEATRKRIFEPFFTTKDPGKGTGLGLAIVYGIVQQHHGHINVYSEPGHGTTFTVYLPISQSPAGRLQERETPALKDGVETVLLAEDDETVRDLSRTVLAESGYTVIIAADGEEAVRKFSENKDSIQLVILDMIMPKKTGNEAYQEIKTMRPDVKALFVSGYTADALHVQQVLAEGLEVMQKPFSPADFLTKIRKVLDKA